mmetsp:Transcript_78829/g.124463  ORF Transcript_78829/g.124463 Transcript_78829/m.124463 type:complete len:405 (-) Transcript_78829:66-1280(-)
MVEYGGTASKGRSIAANPQIGMFAPPQVAKLSPPPPKASAPPVQAATTLPSQVPSGPPVKAPPKAAPEKSEDEAWKDVVQLLQQAGHADRATHYALTYASLNSKLEELQKKRDAVVAAQQSLFKAAEEEGSKFAKLGQPQDMSWGLTLTKAIAEQIEEKLKLKPCQKAGEIIREAHQMVEAKRKAEREEAHPNATQFDAAKRAKAMSQFPGQMTPQSMGGDLSQPKAPQGIAGNSSPWLQQQGKGTSLSQTMPLQSQQKGALAQQTQHSQQSEPPTQNSMIATQQHAFQTSPYNSQSQAGQNIGNAQNGKGYGKWDLPAQTQQQPPQTQHQQPQPTPYNTPQQQMFQPPPATALAKQHSPSQQYAPPQTPVNNFPQQHNMYAAQQQPIPQQGYYGGCGQYGKGW